MRISVEELSPCKRALTVEISPEAVRPAVEGVCGNGSVFRASDAGRYPRRFWSGAFQIPFAKRCSRR
jgi:hypothetical protein